MVENKQESTAENNRAQNNRAQNNRREEIFFMSCRSESLIEGSEKALELGINSGIDVASIIVCDLSIYQTRTILADDAFIFYTYFMNILAGDGFVFNRRDRVNAISYALYPYAKKRVVLGGW